MIETPLPLWSSIISISVKDFNPYSFYIFPINEYSRSILRRSRLAILNIIRAFIASQSLVIRHSALLLRTMASVAATIAVVRASATELGGGSTAEKQKREKRPSENRPMAGLRRGRQEKGPQKYETGGRPTDGLREREIVMGVGGGGGRAKGERRKGRKRRRSPRLDIKNVSCGNLTTGKGGQGRDADNVARKAQEGCVEKQERKRGMEKRREKRVAGADTVYENFYDFYALAPAHLEIRFNSLNFKKLPPLSLAPFLQPRFLILLHCYFPPSRRGPSPILAVPSFSPENEIAPLCVVGNKVLGASRYANPPFTLAQSTTAGAHRHPHGC